MTKSPRDFLANVSGEHLIEVVEQSDRMAVESGDISSSGDGRVELQVHQLQQHYPGLFEFLKMCAADYEELGAEPDFVAGFYAGSVMLARAITLSAEVESLPEL